MSKTVLITGATSGFGLESAKNFALNGFRIIITGRRKARLDQIKDDLLNLGAREVLALNFDVRDRWITIAALESMAPEWKAIDILINNAGLAAGRAMIQDGEIDDWETMIDTNVKGLLYVSRTVIPWMIDRRKGHIINVGSIAGKEVYPMGNVYCATKFSVDALSKAMRQDLLPYGIKVTQICPGLAETEFSLVRFKGDEEKAGAIYKGLTPLVAKDVADIIYYTATLPDHVCINDLDVTCTAQANTVMVHRES